MRDASILIGATRWRIRFVPNSRLPNEDGRCDWNKKEILINKKSEPIETLLHEVAHASNPILYEAEGFVTELARVQAEALAKTRLLDGDSD